MGGQGGLGGEERNGRGGGGALQAGSDASALDLAGVGEARLECTVGNPLKENDGSKDAYVSYSVTTVVGFAFLLSSFSLFLYVCEGIGVGFSWFKLR